MNANPPLKLRLIIRAYIAVPHIIGTVSCIDFPSMKGESKLESI